MADRLAESTLLLRPDEPECEWQSPKGRHGNVPEYEEQGRAKSSPPQDREAI